MESKTRSLELIIPVFDEALSLPSLFERLDSVFSAECMKSHRLSRVQFIFVDDGSSDETSSILAAKIRSGWPGALIRLSRNFGHQPALSAGLDYVRADVVAILDSDLQDPPELILEMLDKMDDGYDVVYGERRSRQESWHKKSAYWLFYRLFALLCDIRMPVDAGDFCLMKQSVVLALRKLPEKLRFHRGLRSWVGFRHAAIPYDRPGRQLGSSKYNFAALYALATNGIASLSIRPLRITQAVLALALLLTLGFLSITTFKVLRRSNADAYSLWFLSTQALIVFTSCLQIFCLYIIGAYVGRMYLEVKSRPAYIVMETLDLKAPGHP